MLLRCPTIGRGFALLLGLSAFVVVVTTVVLARKDWLVAAPPARAAPPHLYSNAVVAANGFECADIGKSILLKNGSAADAAIATLFCEGVSCPQCMGLGGGFLLTVYDSASGTVQVLNARETAPSRVTPDMFQFQSSTEGGLAVAVPGELRGYGALHRRRGVLPWADLVMPTVELCRRGHVVNQYLAASLEKHSKIIHDTPSLRSVYVNKDTGDVYKLGDKIVREDLATSLEVVAREGPDALHNGSLTERFVRDVREYGGVLTTEDMNGYSPVWESPTTFSLTENETLYTSPLPGSGPVLAFIMNMLNGFVGGPDAPYGSALCWHRIVETFKFAYSWRTMLGDPSHDPTMPSSIRMAEKQLLDRRTALRYRMLVNDSATSNDLEHYGTRFSNSEDFGTAHVVVIAPNGDTVSVTSTINYTFGSKRISSSTGITLNNEMDDFSIAGRVSAYGVPPAPANRLGAGARPLSSMVPCIVLDGRSRPRLVLGAAGGTKITTQVALILLGTILERADFGEVMARPRLHHQLTPMAVQHEGGFDPEIIKALQGRAHATLQVRAGDGFAAAVGAARDAHGRYSARTDPRRPGSVAGF